MAAIQAVTGWSRARALKVAKADAHYRDGSGVTRGNIERALVANGFEVEAVAYDPHDSVATFALANDWGTFLVYVDGHVMALVDGDLFNGRGNWGKPLDGATKVLSAGR